MTAAARELREETGISSARTVAIGRGWVSYSHPTVVPAVEAAAPRVRLLLDGAAGAASTPAPSSALAQSGVASNILPFTHVRYLGQTQKWVLMRFHGSEEEVCLGDPSHPNTAFSAWAWLPLEEIVAATVPFKRQVYEGVAREFGPLIEAWRDRPDAEWWGPRE